MTNLKSINEVAYIVRGVSYKPSDASKEKRDGHIPLIRGMNIEEGSLNFDDLIYVNPKCVSSTQKIKKGDVVIVASTGSKKVIGKAAQSKKDWEGSFGAFCLVLRPSDQIDHNYFGYFFQSDYYRMLISHMSSGSNINNLKKEYFDRLQIPILSDAEQKNVVKTLKQTDELRVKRKAVIKLIEEYIKSEFLEMFGDPVNNPKEWELQKFSNVGKLERGKSKHRPRNAPELLGGPYPLIQTGDVAGSDGYIKSYNQTYSEVGLKQSRIWPIGTLCITIAANIARTGILTFKACFPDSIVGFTPNEKIRTEYVQIWLGFIQKTLEDKAPESAQKNINLEILRDLNIPVPPIELQDKFADIVLNSEAIKQKMIVQSEELENHFYALMQKSFTAN